MAVFIFNAHLLSGYFADLCYNNVMIKIIAGGKKNANWVAEACTEYEKRLRKPFDVVWNFMEEERYYG